MTAQVTRADKDVARTKKALDSLESGTCGSCGQSVDHMETHQQHVTNAQEEYNGASDFLREIQDGILHSMQIKKQFRRDQEFFMIACLMHTIIDQLYPHLTHSYKASKPKAILTLIK